MRLPIRPRPEVVHCIKRVSILQLAKNETLGHLRRTTHDIRNMPAWPKRNLLQK